MSDRFNFDASVDHSSITAETATKGASGVAEMTGSTPITGNTQNKEKENL
jgi:hypothetical protein